MKIGFIGLGAMGSRIAQTLLHKGFDVTVWNRKDSSYKNTEHLKKQGAKVADSISDAASDVSAVCLSLTADDAVEETVLQIQDSIRSDTVVVDFSTTSPECSRKMAKLLSSKGCFFVDAPVSGGVKGAEEGKLTIMVGGDESAYQLVRPVIEAVSGYYAYMGKSGNGQTVKLINQILTGVNQATVCEAMLLAKSAGLDLYKTYEVLSNSWGSSRMLDRSVPEYIIPDTYTSDACLGLMEKDLQLGIDVAKKMGLSLFVLEKSYEYYKAASLEGNGKMDHSFIIKIIERN